MSTPERGAGHSAGMGAGAMSHHTSIVALTVWRENRGGGYAGMQSVANVIANRAAKSGASLYEECIRPMQFSSMTAHGDPQLTVYPRDTEPAWIQALQIAADAVAGTLKDITLGATSYYALSMKEPPYWAASMEFTVAIEGQKFYRT